MNLNDPLPFSWEMIWFSLGALLMKISEGFAVFLLGVMMFGGLFGAWAYNRSAKNDE